MSSEPSVDPLSPTTNRSTPCARWKRRLSSIRSAPSRTSNVIANRIGDQANGSFRDCPLAPQPPDRLPQPGPWAGALRTQLATQRGQALALLRQPAAESLGPSARGVPLPHGPLALRLEGVDALAGAVALNDQPALGTGEELHRVELELSQLSLHLIRWKVCAHAPGRPAFKRIGAQRHQAGEALVAHESAGPNALLDGRLVQDQVREELLESTLLVSFAKALEAPPVRKPALEDRDLGTAPELLVGAHREVEYSQRPAGRPDEPGVLFGRRSVTPVRITNRAMNGSTRRANRLRQVSAGAGHRHV